MLMILTIGLVTPGVAGQPTIVGVPSVGWENEYIVGRWAPITVDVSIPDAQPVQLVATAVDPDGNRVQYFSKKETLDAGTHRLTAIVKPGLLDGEVSVRVNDGEVLRGTPGKVEWLRKPWNPSTRLVATAGFGALIGFGPPDEADLSKSSTKPRYVTVSPDKLPSNPAAYDALSVLTLFGSLDSIKQDQVEAIRFWVARGGHLVLSLRQDVAAAKESISKLGSWMPVTVADTPATVREFGGLELFAGKNVRMPQQSALTIPSLQSQTGEVLATSRTDAFLIEAPYGMGSVTVLALDLTAAPINQWSALPSFCQRLTSIRTVADIQDRSGPKSSQLSSTGITDLATQLHGIQDDFKAVHRRSPWFVMAMLAGLLIVVGPIDYLTGQRVLKQSYSTWITFPILILAGTTLAYALASSSNGVVNRVNQLDIVNYDVESSTMFSRHFATLYSPTTSRHSIELVPRALTASSESTTHAVLNWAGVPEVGFGGMLRESGFERGADYQRTEEGSLENLPIIQWGSKSIDATSTQVVDNLVTCDLRASTTGRLTGTITHRLATPIEDWMVVYRNVVYRHLKKRDDSTSVSLTPNQVWRVDQPSVYSRELRPFLTGIITIATPRFGESHAIDTTTKHTAYDSLSLDPFQFMRILTFHDQIGGTRYTGLTNQLLDEEDCSNLLRLGRAILFGRLSQPAASLQFDKSPMTADRQDGFIRIVLPVTRSKEVLKHLERVVDP